MAVHLGDPETDALIRDLARKRGVGLKDAVKLAVRNQLRTEALPLRERIRPIVESVAAYPDTGLKADKAFFDELSGD